MTAWKTTLQRHLPENFAEAYTGVLEAIVSWNLTEERIDESLVRILKVKLEG